MDFKFDTGGGGFGVSVYESTLEFRNSNGGSNMVDKNLTTDLIRMIFPTRRFLGSLITITSLKVRNSKSRIQYDGR